MTLLILGLVIFFGVHSIAIFAPAFRDAARGRLGENGWKGVYSVVSLAGFVLLCYGFGLARHTATILYVAPPWLRTLALVLMLPVFPLLLAAYLPGRIKTAAKHPMLAAVKFWALAHLLANGSLADILLFGGFLAWAVADRIALKRRAAAPRAAAAARPWNDAIAIVLGLGIYALFVLWAHQRLFGVAPLG